MKPVRLVNIDVEGVEQLVLSGIRRTLARDMSDLGIKVTDAYLHAFGHRANSSCRFLLKLGCRMYRITEPGPVGMGISDLPSGQYSALFTTAERARRSGAAA